MDELFNFLSSTARIDKSKRKKKNKAEPVAVENFLESSTKNTHSESKQKHIHQEQINAFRNRVGISLSHKNKHDASIPDPISSFAEFEPPAWWTEKNTFQWQSSNHPHLNIDSSMSVEDIKKLVDEFINLV